MVVKLPERAAGHYEVQEVEFGTVYRWRPEGGVVDECCCGPALADPEVPCALHPWRSGCASLQYVPSCQPLE